MRPSGYVGYQVRGLIASFWLSANPLMVFQRQWRRLQDIRNPPFLREIASVKGSPQTKSVSNGYDDTYAVYCLGASENLVSFVYTPAVGKPVRNPIFKVQNFTAGNLPALLVNATSVTVNSGAGSGAFVSLDTSSSELWVTLNASVDAALKLELK